MAKLTAISLCGRVLSLLLLLFLSFCPARCQDWGDMNNALTTSLDLPIRQWRDQTVPLKAVVLAIHGVTLHSGSFSTLAQHLASQGYLVVAADLRGFGVWSGGEFKNKRHHGVNYLRSNKDLSLLIKSIREQYANVKLYCLGESLGANYALYLAANYPEQIDGIVLSSPCIRRYRHICPRSIYDIARGCLNPFRDVSLRPYVAQWLSDDPRVTAEYLKDPLVRKELKTYEAAWSLIANNSDLKCIKHVPKEMPILIMAGSEDKIYKPCGVEVLNAELATSKKTVLVEKGKGHLLLETSYIDPKILKLVDDWLNNECASGGPVAQANR